MVVKYCDDVFVIENENADKYFVFDMPMTSIKTHNRNHSNEYISRYLSNKEIGWYKFSVDSESNASFSYRYAYIGIRPIVCHHVVNVMFANTFRKKDNGFLEPRFFVYFCIEIWWKRSNAILKKTVDRTESKTVKYFRFIGLMVKVDVSLGCFLHWHASDQTRADHTSYNGSTENHMFTLSNLIHSAILTQFGNAFQQRLLAVWYWFRKFSEEEYSLSIC